MAMDRVMSGHPREALVWADKALALADQLGGLPEERLRALDSRGVARGDLGDLGGMDDLRAALTIGLEVGAGYDTAVVYNNLIEPLWLSEGPAAALAMCQEAIEFTERRGLGEGTAWIRSATLTPLLDLGRWDEAVDSADALIAWERDHGGQYMSEMAHQIKATVLLWRGEVDAARVLARDFLPRARAIDDLQLLVPALAVAAAWSRRPATTRPRAVSSRRCSGWSATGAAAAGTWASTSPSWCGSVLRSATAPPPRPSPPRRTTASPATDMGSSPHVPPLPRPTGRWTRRRGATTRRRPAGRTTATSSSGHGPCSAPDGACSPSASRLAGTGCTTPTRR